MFDVDAIIKAGGLLAITLIVFAESGLLVGIILPGDSLLLAAGVFAGRGHLPLDWLILLIILASIVGYEVGYSFGKKIGPKMFSRKDGFLFKEEYLGRTEKFFNRYGAITLVVGRFVAHVRTLIPLIAGAGSMDRRKFFSFNVIGALLWGGGLTLLGYFLGARVPNIDYYIIPAVIFTLVVLYGFTLWHLLKTPQKRRDLKAGLKQDWNYFFGSKNKSR